MGRSKMIQDTYTTIEVVFAIIGAFGLGYFIRVLQEQKNNP